MLRVVTDDYVMLHAKVPFGLRTPLTADALRVDLTYDTRAPYAIHCAPATAGEGDVRLRPSARAGSTLIDLRAPGGRVELVTRTSELAAFLHQTCAVVRFGDENHWIDFEDELARLG